MHGHGGVLPIAYVGRERTRDDIGRIHLVAYVHVYRTQSKTAAKCIWLWQMRLSCIWLKVSSFLLVDVKFDNLTCKLPKSNIKI